MVDLVVPNDVGGFWVREWGLFDNRGFLVAVGPHAEMHKPLITSGQAAEFLLRFHLPVSNKAAITLTISSQALASQEFVEAELGKHRDDLEAHGSLFQELLNYLKEALAAAATSMASLVPITRKIIVTGSLSGGGSLDQDVTIGFTAPASVPPARAINTTAPLTGGGDLSANRTLAISAATAATATANGAAGSAVYAADNAGASVRNMAATPAMVHARTPDATAATATAAGAIGRVILAADNVGDGVRNQALTPAGGVAKHGKKPQTASGVGQWTLLYSSGSGNVVLPTGGTWAFFLIGLGGSNTTGTVAINQSAVHQRAGIVAGGTSFAPPPVTSGGQGLLGFAWRIA